ncbi:MAG: right-handed parallel beta-helix repeat-containing protein [Aquabacterium sp.]|nr:right-handed parallel beta-helix repeat-containing protein [Aquabacterium sp.]
MLTHSNRRRPKAPAWAVAAWLAAAASCAPGQGSAATVFFVAPDGSDNWSGTLAAPSGTDGPFQTLSRAKVAVQRQVAAGMTSDVIVQIRGGEYAQTALYFNHLDSGRDGYQVIWRNHPGERPLIHGGRRITGWQRDVGNIYKAPVSWPFHTLYENGVRAQKARYPNTTSDNPFVYSRTTVAVAGADTTKFGFAAGDVPAVSDPASLEVVLWPAGPDGIWNWKQQTLTVGGIDHSARILTLGRDTCCGQPPAQAPWTISVGSRYFVQGARELLDQPGEFRVGNGYLYYWPRQTPIEEQVIVAPGPTPGNGRALPVLILGNTGETASNLQFEGLAIAYTDRNLPGIFAADARQVGIKGNHVFGIGGNGVEADGQINKLTVEGNLVHGVGGDGINVYGHESVGRPSEFTIRNNHVHHTGEIAGDSAGISVGSSSHGVIAHNLIHDVPRAGLRVYGFAHLNPPVFDATELRFEFNDVSRAVTDSQDSGLLHTGGVGPGVTIHNNRFHDSALPFSFGEGLYLDMCNTGVAVSHNIVDGLQAGAAAGLAPGFDGRLWPDHVTFHGIHIVGSDISVVNNVVSQNRLSRGEIGTSGNNPSADCQDARVQTRDASVKRNIFAGNAVDAVYSFLSFDEGQVGAADENLFFHASGIYNVGFGYGGGPVFSSSTESLDQWRTGHARAFDRNTILADPRFVDAAKRDFRLRPDSPAHRLGFREIDQAAIGLTADFPYADPAESLARLFVGTALSGPSATLRLAPLQTAQMAVTARTRSGYLITPAATALSFSSDKPEIAAVGPLGEVSAGRTGLATITVAAAQGEQRVSTVLFVDVAGPVSTAQSDCLFDWAETRYRAELSPAGARSAVFDPYYYRYYPGTGAYVGVAMNDRHLYYLGPLSDQQLLDLGAASDWYAAAGCR